MNNYVVLTDSTTDLPLEFLRENKIEFLSLSYLFKDESFKDDLGENTDLKAFYGRMRNGEMPTTTQINVADYIDVFEKLLLEGKDIIYIGFSSALSGSFNSSLIARNELIEKYSDRKIECIDSKCASLGEGLLVYLINEKLKEEISFNELVDFANLTREKIHHWFTVDDLNHLFRGGRVSRVAAVLGTLMNIKPVLNVDENGRLTPREKVRGRKQAIMYLYNKFKELAINPENQTVFISHGDCIEDANYLKDLILNSFKIKDCIINYVGPVIGAHSGPGTLALFFLGKDRNF